MQEAIRKMQEAIRKGKVSEYQDNGVSEYLAVLVPGH